MSYFLIKRSDGGVSIVIEGDKPDITRTILEWEKLAKPEYLPIVEIREINASDIPGSREFRNAWTDVTSETRIDINCDKAKQIQLEKLRSERNKKLEELDKQFMLVLEKDEGAQTTIDEKQRIIDEKQRLRDITNPLKALNCEGVYNDEAVLNQIKELSDNE